MTTRSRITLFALTMSSALAAHAAVVDDPPAAAPPGLAGDSSEYGEPVAGFASWYERMMLVLVNRARADPITDLESCSSCADAGCFTGPLPPMQWRQELNLAARFHAANLTYSGCSIRHDSPCDLVADVASLYPGSCDGSVACACQGGTADCNGTGPFERMGLFSISGGGRGENIASSGDPFSIFYLWLHEPTSDPTCSWSFENGHRWNILGSFNHIGIGASGRWVVQDFWNIGSLSEKILAGAHYPQSGTAVDLRASWYDGAGPTSAEVNIDGTCYPMTIERGGAANATYLADLDTAPGCRRYYFAFEDSTGATIEYPTTGSFGIDCGDDWTATRPASCQATGFTVLRFTAKADLPDYPDTTFAAVALPFEDPDAVLSATPPLLFYQVSEATSPVFVTKTATSIELHTN